MKWINGNAVGSLCWPCSLDGPERCSGLLIKRRGFESLLTACKNLSTVNIGISADIVSAGVE